MSCQSKRTLFRLEIFRIRRLSYLSWTNFSHIVRMNYSRHIGLLLHARSHWRHATRRKTTIRRDGWTIYQKTVRLFRLNASSQHCTAVAVWLIDAHKYSLVLLRERVVILSWCLGVLVSVSPGIVLRPHKWDRDFEFSPYDRTWSLAFCDKISRLWV